jgi:hypothetical protein
MKNERTFAAMVGKSLLTQSDKELIRVLLVRGVDIDRVAKLIHTNKVRHCARRNLARLLDQTVLDQRYQVMLNRLMAALEKRQAATVNFREAIGRVASMLNESGLRATLIKGGSLLFLLPNYVDRLMGDVDIVLPDLDTLWQAARKLLTQGYAFNEKETAWIRRCGIDGFRLQGHLTLKDSHSGASLDLHSYNMSLGAGVLECDLFARASQIEVGTGRIFVPAPEDALLILAAHGYGHGFFRMRDVNDIMQFLSAYKDTMDWSYFLRCVKINGLEDVLAHLDRSLQQFYGIRFPVEFQARNNVLHHALRLTNGITGEPTLWRLAWFYGLSDFLSVKESSLFRRLRSSWRSFSWSILMGLRSERGLPLWLDRWLAENDRGPLLSDDLPIGYPIFLAPLQELSRRISAIPWDERLWSTTLRDMVSYSRNATFVVGKGTEELIVTPAAFFAPTRSMLFTEAQWSRLEDLGEKTLGQLLAAYGVIEVSGNSSGD